jgi:hypothetical protein
MEGRALVVKEYGYGGGFKIFSSHTVTDDVLVSLNCLLVGCDGWLFLICCMI